MIYRPWNYPLVLALQPVYAAISAGCPALIKPSELVPRVSALLATLIHRYLDPRAYIVVQGSVPETTRLLQLRWAHSTSFIKPYHALPFNQTFLCMTMTYISLLHWERPCCEDHRPRCRRAPYTRLPRTRREVTGHYRPIVRGRREHFGCCIPRHCRATHSFRQGRQCGPNVRRAGLRPHSAPSAVGICGCATPGVGGEVPGGGCGY